MIGNSGMKTLKKVMQKLATKTDKVRLVTFSNQAGLNERRKKAEEKMIQLRRKLKDAAGKLAVPITIMVATDHDDYRKPRWGMWNYTVDHIMGGVKLKPKDCLFVGDAAGRASEEGRRGDFADSDRKFAESLGIQLKTLEEIFTSTNEN